MRPGDGGEKGKFRASDRREREEWGDGGTRMRWGERYIRGREGPERPGSAESVEKRRESEGSGRNWRRCAGEMRPKEEC